MVGEEWERRQKNGREGGGMREEWGGGESGKKWDESKDGGRKGREGGRKMRI